MTNLDTYALREQDWLTSKHDYSETTTARAWKADVGLENEAKLSWGAFATGPFEPKYVEE